MKRNAPPSRKAPVTEVLAPRNLPYQIFLLVQQMTKRFQEILTPHGLTPLHWGILCCLWEEDGLGTTEIATLLEQLGGTVTVGLDAMERDGLLQRKKDHHDGRISRIFLTKRGASLKSTLAPAAAALIDEMFVTLTPDQYRDLATQISHLRRALSKSRESSEK